MVEYGRLCSSFPIKKQLYAIFSQNNLIFILVAYNLTLKHFELEISRNSKFTKYDGAEIIEHFRVRLKVILVVLDCDNILWTVVIV